MPLKDDQIVEIILKNRIRIIAFIRSIVCDFHVSEDLYQKLCLKALQSPEKFDNSAHLWKWIWVVSRNESLNHLRQQKSRPVVLDEQILELIQQESEKASFLDDPEIFAILENCISRLSEPVRKLLENRYRYSLSGLKLAEVLNKNVNSVYVSISRAHRFLYDCMSRQLKPVRE